MGGGGGGGWRWVEVGGGGWRWVEVGGGEGGKPVSMFLVASYCELW